MGGSYDYDYEGMGLLISEGKSGFEAEKQQSKVSVVLWKFPQKLSIYF